MTDKLLGCHPHLAEKVERILHTMEAFRHPMIVTEGVRSTERQVALYAQGRTAPGKIVTQLDGITKKSNHQVKTDGYGYAADLAFLINGQPTWDDKLPWGVMGKMAQYLGLIWGGTWIGLVDRPHVELPRFTSNA